MKRVWVFESWHQGVWNTNLEVLPNPVNLRYDNRKARIDREPDGFFFVKRIRYLLCNQSDFLRGLEKIGDDRMRQFPGGHE